QLIDALRGLYGDEQYEYWNAGVEATDTNQQLWFYTHHNHKIEPDHVFLTFHNNDFVSQPVVDHSGTRVNIYDTMGSCEYRLPWPLAHSACARWLLVRHYQIEKREALAKQAIEHSLAALQQRLADDGVGFSVILFPILKPHADWSATELKSRED